MEKENTSYEIGYLLSSGLTEEEVAAFCVSLRNFVTEQNGLILTEGTPKNQPLSFPIKKELTAFFNWIKFVINPKSIEKIKEYLDKQPAALRYLLMRFKEPTPKKISTKPKNIIKKYPATEPSPETAQMSAVKPAAPAPLGEEEIDKKIEELLSNN